MANQEMSKEQLQEVLKKNPEFAKKLAEQERLKDSTNPTRVFEKFTDAMGVLGLMEADSVKLNGSEQVVPETKLEIQKNSNSLGSGIIESKTQFIPYLTGKVNLSIALNEIKLNKNVFRIQNADTEITYNDAFKIIRICIIQKDVSGHYSTIAHLAEEDFCKAGRHLLAVKEIEIEKDKPGLKVVFDINPTAKTIKFSGAKSAEDIIEKLNRDDQEEWFIVPLLISETNFNSTNELIEQTWDKVKDDFVSKLIANYKDEEKNKLISFVEYQVASPTFSKGLAIYALDHEQVTPITNAIENNSKQVDPLNIVALLYPKYGSEYIDIEKEGIVIDEKIGVPVLTEKDLDNLKVVGIQKEMVQQIITSAINTLRISEEVLKKYQDEAKTAEDIKNKAYDAECKIIADIESGEDWKSIFDVPEYDALLDDHLMEKDVELAESNKKNISQEVASLQLTSKRIKEKVSNGEFTNVYMQLCNNYFYSLYKSIFTVIDTEKNITPFPMYLALMENDLLGNTGKAEDSYSFNKVVNIITNTLDCKTKRDKYGNVPDNLFDKVADNLVGTLVDPAAVPDNLPEDEMNKHLMDMTFIRYNYIDSLSRTPFKFISKLHPSITAVCKGTEVKEEELARSKEYANSIFLDNPEDERIELLLDNLKAIREEIEGEFDEHNGEWFDDCLKIIMDYSAKIEANKAKSKLDKCKIFAKYAIVFNNMSYLQSIVNGVTPIEITPTALAEVEKDQESYIIQDSEGNTYNIGAYKELSADKKKSVVISKKLTLAEKKDCAMDFLLRLALFSEFVYEYIRLDIAYTSHADEVISNDKYKNSEKVDSEKMFVSEFSLMVPSISVLEMPLKEKEDGTIDLDEAVPTNSKIKLGSDAVNDALKDIEIKDNLINARQTYYTECIEVAELAVRALMEALEIK